MQEKFKCSSLIVFSGFWSMLGKEISEAHTKQFIFRWMLEVCVHLCVKQSMCTHVEIMQAKALSLSLLSLFASVYGHNLLCVCVQSHAQWPHLLSLSSDVYLEQCSSEIKGQKQRVVCSFISAPSDGGWQFLQLTPPDAFTAVGMCAVYAYVCVCSPSPWTSCSTWSFRQWYSFCSLLWAIH